MRVPTIHNVTLVAGDTEYVLALPDCYRFEFHARVSDDDIRFAFETGYVATPTEPYFTLHGGQEYYSYHVGWRRPTAPSPVNIYFASGTAGAVVEVITWR